MILILREKKFHPSQTNNWSVYVLYMKIMFYSALFHGELRNSYTTTV